MRWETLPTTPLIGSVVSLVWAPSLAPSPAPSWPRRRLTLSLAASLNPPPASRIPTSTPSRDHQPRFHSTLTVIYAQLVTAINKLMTDLSLTDKEKEALEELVPTGKPKVTNRCCSHSQERGQRPDRFAALLGSKPVPCQRFVFLFSVIVFCAKQREYMLCITFVLLRLSLLPSNQRPALVSGSYCDRNIIPRAPPARMFLLYVVQLVRLGGSSTLLEVLVVCSPPDRRSIEARSSLCI